MNQDRHSQPLQNALWRAGAGAGKTYNLVERVLRIAAEWSRTHNGELPRLVVTTFTRMATQELRVRLMEAVLRQLKSTDSDSRLVQFVTSRSQLFVTTMHGVMESYLRSFAREAGLDPGFRVAQADEKKSVMRRVAQPILQSGPDAVIANFGFRRSMDVLHRTAQLLIENPELRVASTDELLDLWKDELRRFIPDLLDTKREIEDSGNSKWDPFLEWFKGFVKALKAVDTLERCEDLVPALQSLRAELKSSPAIDNRSQPKVQFSRGKDWKSVFSDLETRTEAIEAEIEGLEEASSLNQSLLTMASDYGRALLKEKRKTGLLELEDLELLSLQLMRERPETAATFSESWDHWLIDEYQDTSPRQVRLLNALAQGRGHFIVGDPQQSIYLFRGARPGVFRSREALAVEKNHRLENLTVNRRSSAPVMDLINAAVGELGPEFQPMQAHRTELGKQSPFGVGHFLNLGAIEKEKASEQRRRESVAVASAVSSLIRTGVEPEAIALLARKNTEILELGQALETQGVPHQIFTSGAFSDRQEITDLAALLSFIVNPHDDFNLIHVARAPWFPIDEDTLCLGYRRQSSLWKSIEDRDESEALRNVLQVARERGVVEAFKAALLSCDFFSFCGALDPSGRREANALKFLTRLATAERQVGFNPRRFVDEILEVGDDKGSDRDAVAAKKPNRVSVMTIHASKGLEFDHVFIPFAGFGRTAKVLRTDVLYHEDRGLYAVSIKDSDDGANRLGVLGRSWAAQLSEWEQEEDRRLLYVALTRAKESLFVSSIGEAKNGSFAHMIRQTLASEFFTPSSELPVEGMELSSQLASIPSKRDRPPVPPAISMTQVLSRCQQERAGSSRPLVVNTLSVTQILELEAASRAHATAVPTSLDRAIGFDAPKNLLAAKKAADGTRVHRIFELAKYIVQSDGGAISSERIEQLGVEIARWFGVTEAESAMDADDAKGALRWLLELKEPNMSQVLSRGEAEWGFVYRTTFQGQVVGVEGQIDLWGRDETNRLWVIDYKTGSPKHAEKAMRQLEYYAGALRAAKIAEPSETVRMAAVFPFSSEIFTKDDPAVLK